MQLLQFVARLLRNDNRQWRSCGNGEQRGTGNVGKQSKTIAEADTHAQSDSDSNGNKQMHFVFETGEPDPLLNCTLLNQTSSGFQIECIEGFDGGLQQDFIMEVYVNGTTRYPKIYKSK